MKQLASRISMILALALLVLATACSGSDKFTVKAEVEGLGTQNVRLVFYDGGKIQTTVIPAVDSKFNLESSTGGEVVYEVFSNDRVRIGCFAARNGEEIVLKYNVADPTFMEVSGNETSVALADFLKNNSGDKFNANIEKYAEKHPGEPLSDILLAYYYDPSVDTAKALKLYETIKLESAAFMASGTAQMVRRAQSEWQPAELTLRCSADSLMHFNPVDKKKSTLICFEVPPTSADSINPSMRGISTDERRVVLVRMSADTVGWARQIAKMPKGIIHLWAPASVAEPALGALDIPRLPYYVEVDSVGNVVSAGDLKL